MIWDDRHCIYHAGDTALTFDMKLIPQTCPVLDYAILPIGDTFTMGYEDALVAAEFLNCDQVIGCHFDTFPPIEIDHAQAVQHFQERGKSLTLMEIGESLAI